MLIDPIIGVLQLGVVTLQQARFGYQIKSRSLTDVRHSLCVYFGLFKPSYKYS